MNAFIAQDHTNSFYIGRMVFWIYVYTYIQNTIHNNNKIIKLKWLSEHHFAFSLNISQQFLFFYFTLLMRLHTVKVDLIPSRLFLNAKLDLPVCHEVNTTTILLYQQYSVPIPPKYHPYGRPIHRGIRLCYRIRHEPSNSENKNKKQIEYYSLFK